MIKNVSLVLAGVSAVFATAAMAGGPEPMQGPVAAHPHHQGAHHAANHFYVGGGLGYGHVAYPSFSSDEVALLGDSPEFKTEKNGLVADLHAGYQFLPNFAVEVGGLLLPQVKVKGKKADSDSYQTDIKTTQMALTAAVKGCIPVAEKISVFAKAGLGVNHVKATGYTYSGETVTSNSASNNRVEPLFAIGAAYQVAPQVDVNVEALTLIRSHMNNYAGLVGVNYHFV